MKNNRVVQLQAKLNMVPRHSEKCKLVGHNQKKEESTKTL